MSFIVIYVTHPNLESAKKITTHLLQKKLIACANFFPIQSQFSWKGKIEESEEIVSLMKAPKPHWETIVTEIKKMHSYETPCIIKFDAEGEKEYEAWLHSV